MRSRARRGRATSVRSSPRWRAVGIVLAVIMAGCADHDVGRSAPGGSTSPGESPITTTIDDDPSSSGTSTVVDGELEVDRRTRTYRLVVPSSAADGDPLPLVLILHGNGTDAASIAEKTGFDAIAEQEGFLAVYPEVAEDAGVWNGGFSHRADDVDDVAFLRAVVEQVGKDHPVDPDRVVATGLSGGGMMAYRLACEAPDLVAAIAPVAATMVGDCSPAAPVSVLHIHGSADQGIPFDGREDRGFPPVRGVLDTWGAVGGCDPDPHESTADSVTASTWTGCDPGIDVELVLIERGAHEYPRAELGAPIDGPTVVWAFFAAHPKPG